MTMRSSFAWLDSFRELALWIKTDNNKTDSESGAFYWGKLADHILQLLSNLDGVIYCSIYIEFKKLTMD
jgi:hypothetical protein